MGKQWLDWRPELSLWQTTEVVLLSTLALGIAYWVHPADPLALRGGFPWAWFAPVLVALRYGMLTGLLSATILLLGALFAIHGGALPERTALGTPLGALILTMICGEYSGLWRNRQRRQTELNQYLDERLEELTRHHYLLKLSHDRLEQNLISRPHTLRGSLMELRDLLKQADASQGLPEAGAFIALLAAHCQLTVAALYPAKKGHLIAQAAAATGEPAALSLQDPLVAYALTQCALSHVNQAWIEGESTSDYLIVAPIYRDEVLVGLLTVEHMPFFAFHQDTLQTLTALISYYADTFASQQTRSLLAVFPDCPLDFAQHLGRLAKIQQASGVVSYLCVLTFPGNDQGLEVRHRLAQSKRELDFYWLRDSPQTLLIALFPLTTDEGIKGYLARVDVWLEAEYGRDRLGLDIHIKPIPLAAENVLDQLKRSIGNAT